MAFPDESYELMMSGLRGIPAQAPAPPPVVTPTTQVAPRQEPPSAATPPAAQRPSAPAQPGGQETVEALRQLLAQFQNRAATPRAESQSGGLLDALRQRVQAQMAGEDDRRLRDIGSGMLASRSPNFFSMLGEGFKAGEEDSRARLDRLRQLAETERQERALESQEAARRDQASYQQSSLALRRLEAERAGRPQYQVVGQDAQGNAIVMDPRNPGQTTTLQGVTPIQIAAQNIRSDSATLTRATAAGTRAVSEERRRRTDAGITAPMTPQEEETIFQNAFERARRAPAGGAAPGTEAAPAAAPSETLQYNGPRIAPRQQ